MPRVGSCHWGDACPRHVGGSGKYIILTHAAEGYGRDRSISGGGHRVGEPGMVFGGDPGRPGADPKRGLAAEAGIHGRYLQSR